MRKFVLFQCDYSENIKNSSCDPISQVCEMVVYILPSSAKTQLGLFCNSNCILLCSHITLSSSSNVNIVEWLVSIPSVRLFFGSAITIFFGIACRGYTFDRTAFNILFKKVQRSGLGFMQGVCLSFGLGFTFRVQVYGLGFGFRFQVQLLGLDFGIRCEFSIQV